MGALNQVQLAASQIKKGPVLVKAGPGSGKTRVITARAAYLAAEAKVPPQRMIVVTFTKAAATEMHSRIAALVDPTLVSRMHIQTIHSLAYQYVTHVQGPPKIMDDRMQRNALKSITKSLQLEEDMIDAYLQEYTNCINRMTSINSYTPTNMGKKPFRKIHRLYQEQKQQHSLMDFDDLLVKAYDILTNARSIPNRYIMVDEFQDTSLLQYELLKLLARPTNNFFVVGDEDQSIYSWRGGCNAPLLFAQDFPEARQIPLEINYRSTKQIVAVSTSMIKQNSERLDKELNAGSDNKEGVRPQFVTPADEQEEAQAVHKYLVDKSHAGYQWEDMAVIYRTKYQGILLQQRLTKQKIPFRILGEQLDIANHWIARDLFAYLKLALDPDNPEYFFHILNRPGRYISTDTVHRAKALVSRLNITPLDALRRQQLTPPQREALAKLEKNLEKLAKRHGRGALEYIGGTIGFNEYIDKFAQHIGGNHEEYQHIAEIISELPLEQESIADFVERIPELNLGLVKQSSAGVTLTTCHSAKGLEYAVVALISAVEGVLPYRKAISSKDASAAIEEERRLAYVAITRSKEHLLVSSPKLSRKKKVTQSRFVKEMKAGVIRNKLARNGVIAHPSWGQCTIKTIGDNRVILLTPAGAEKQVLYSWLLEKELV